jgi:CRP-like cAMP-binding protein
MKFSVINETRTVYMYPAPSLIPAVVTKANMPRHYDSRAHASVLGRRLSAASTAPTSRDKRVSGAAGAWINEIAFLEHYWIKEQRERAMTTEGASKTPLVQQEQDEQDTHSDDGNSDESEKRTVAPPTVLQSRPTVENALYTVFAEDDCTLMVWSKDDMEKILEHSPDLRASMTR